MKKDLLIQIGISVIVVCILIGVCILILSKFTPSTICESYCNQNNGKFWIASDCDGDTLACSGWCELPNQTMYCKDIFNNITSMDS
jgi:hypothetical protein